MIYDASSLYILLKRGDLNALSDAKTLDLAFYEIGDSMLKELLRKLMTPETFEKALGVLSMIGEMVQVRKFAELDVRRVSKVAKDAGLTFYDAAYLTLALMTKEILVTDDGLLKRKADGMGIRTSAA